MATRSSIIVEMGLDAPGRWAIVTVHRLGEPEHRAPLLLGHYAEAEKVRALVALGDLSLVDREIISPPGHSFDTPVDGHSIAYGRDRAEDEEDDEVAPRFFVTLAAALETATEEFVYVFRDARWWWAFTDDGAVRPEDLKLLTRQSSLDEAVG